MSSIGDLGTVQSGNAALFIFLFEISSNICSTLNNFHIDPIFGIETASDSK